MAAYTRTTGKKVLIQRVVWSGPTRVLCVQAVPVSKVLKPLPCDVCRNMIERGAIVLREKHWDYYRTTCENCAEFLPLESLL